jgi:PhnB protein
MHRFKEIGMKTTIQPYLFFNGRCEEALDFYRKALGAEVTALLHYRDSPDPASANNTADKVMHANFQVGETQIMASDGQSGAEPGFEGFALALNVATEVEAMRLFDGLRDGGQVQAPLTKTFYSPCFGMVSDRFGILWMIIASAEQAA